MKRLDDTGCETIRRSSNLEEDNRSETSHNTSLLIVDSMKPCQQTRENVKEWLLKLRSCMEAVCGMEWYGYAALGMLTAILSFLIDLSVTKLLRAHQWLYMKLEGNNLLQFFCWTLYPACLCAVASSFSHNICPFSTGSGIPEVRTMLAGIEMPLYLSLTNMFTKFLGLICTLAAGSTVFLGKVGPFVHFSVMIGAYLSNLCSLIQTNDKEKVAGEMLVVAAAVGVASCFGAPISGVLFSVEVMGSHFALRHYYPCFFSAACGALIFRLLSVLSGDRETLQALFRTNFPTALPFYPLEILLFALLGLLCGAVSCGFLLCHRWILHFTKTNPIFIKMLATEKGLYSGMVAFFLACLTFPESAGQYMASKTLQALFRTNFPTALPFYPLEILLFALLGLLCGAVSCGFLLCHRWILHFTKTNPIFIKMLATEKGLYSGMVAFFLACLTFPESAGQYMASKLTMKQLLTSLLDSSQWASQSHNASVQPLLEWNSLGSPVYLSLAVFLLMKMWMFVLVCTLPLPAGYFMQMFVYGAALGRLLGEGVAYVSSTGGISGQQWASINPGGYALAGAAAFSGAVTHSLSPALLAVELTGQFSHAVPILLATLLANAVARSGNRPSFYDALSISKRLPHLPSLMKACPSLGSKPVGQVLGVKSVQLQKAAGPVEVQQAVNTCTETQIPVVDSHESQILVGFVLRSDLLMFLCRSKTEALDKYLDDICPIYPASVLLSPHTTIQEAHSILNVVGAQTVFVTDRGRLVGLITGPEMKRIIEDSAKEI